MSQHGQIALGGWYMKVGQEHWVLVADAPLGAYSESAGDTGNLN